MMQNTITLYAPEQNLASAAVDYDFEPAHDGDVAEIITVIRDSNGDLAPISNDDLVITRKEANSDNYAKWNAPILSQPLDGLSSFVWRPVGRCIFSRGDKINIAISKDNCTDKAYITLKYFQRSSL